MSEPKLNGCALGKSHEKKAAFLLDFVQITSLPSPPIWSTCTTLFRRQNSRFESQFRTKNTIERETPLF